VTPSTSDTVGKLAICALLLSANGAASGQAQSNASHQMYLELLHKAESFAGQPLSFAGKVIQSIQTGPSTALRVNVTPGPYNSWQDTIYVDTSALAAKTPIKVADGDLVSVRGTFAGIKSYQSVIGDTIEVPSVIACMIRPGVENISACPGETATPPANPSR
jgi:hypothetical protein